MGSTIQYKANMPGTDTNTARPVNNNRELTARSDIQRFPPPSCLQPSALSMRPGQMFPINFFPSSGLACTLLVGSISKLFLIYLFFTLTKNPVLANVFSGKLSHNYQETILIPPSREYFLLLFGKRLFSIKYNNLNRMSTVCKFLNESFIVAGLNTIHYEGSYGI